MHGRQVLGRYQNDRDNVLGFTTILPNFQRLVLTP